MGVDTPSGLAGGKAGSLAGCIFYGMTNAFASMECEFLSKACTTLVEEGGEGEEGV